MTKTPGRFSSRIALVALALAAVLPARAVSAQCVADLNGDRIVNGADLGILLNAWGTCPNGTPGCTGDLDSDGSVSGGVDGADLGILLAAWGNCPGPVVPSWATLIEAQPDPAVVTDPALRAAIEATGLAWRVRDTATQIEMLLVPPGTFQMGCTTGSIDFPCDSGWLFASNPPHSVTLSNPYYLGRFEVTQAQWVAAMGANPSAFQAANGFPGSDTRPVEGVGWLLVQEFLLGNGLRLPTEAEWEFACRAGTQTPFYNGSIDDGSLGDLAWYSGNSLGQTHPVGLKQPNGFGFFDMLGNAFEWVNDWFGFYTADPQQDPTGPVVRDSHVLRGGTALGSIMWTSCHGRTNAAPLNPPCCPDGGQGWGFGFRVARNP